MGGNYVRAFSVASNMIFACMLINYGDYLHVGLNKVNLIDYILLFQIPTLSFLYELFYQTYYANYISFFKP